MADITSLVYTPVADANGTGYSTLTFRVRDDGGTASGGVDTDQTANTLTFDVTSINDAPAGSDDTITIAENGAHTFSVADFGFSDAADGDALQAVIIDTVPTVGTLMNGLTAVNDGDTIAVADITSLVYTPVADANGTGYSTLTFRVRDDGGTANGGVDTDQTANTLTFDVTSINDAPAGSDNTITIAENGAHTFSVADFGFSDAADGDALQAVIIDTVPTVGTLMNGLTAVNDGDTIAVADITSLVYTPVADANGTGYSTLTFRVRDDGGTANGGVDTDQTANTLTFDVTSINDAPAGSDNTITIAENGAHTFSVANFGFSDAADGDALQAVIIDTVPTVGTLMNGLTAVNDGDTIAVADITSLVYTPVADANGTGYSTLTFRVRDDGGTASGGVDTDQTANTLTFDVTSINDAPAGSDDTITIAENGAHTFSVADFGFSDAADGDALQAVIIDTVPTVGTLMNGLTAVNDGDTIAVADITSLVYTPVADANGTGYSTLTFRVRDDGGTGQWWCGYRSDGKHINVRCHLHQ